MTVRDRSRSEWFLRSRHNESPGTRHDGDRYMQLYKREGPGELIAQMQANTRDFYASVQAGDSRPKGYDHYAKETTRNIVGAGLTQTLESTTSAYDDKTVSSCTLAN